MQFFLQEDMVVNSGDDSSGDKDDLDVSTLKEMELIDRPVYNHRIDISKITIGGPRSQSYKKKRLYTIVKKMFGIKTLGLNKKSDAVKFLLDPVRIDQIKYNNSLIDRLNDENNL